MTSDLPVGSVDPEKQRQAKRLRSIRLRLSIIDFTLSLAAVLALIFSGASSSFIPLLGLPVVAGAVAYFAILLIGSRLVLSPLDYYSDFTLGHRFGLSTESFRSWLVDQLKSAALGLILGSLVIALLYEFILISPDWWWLIAWAVMIMISVVLSNLAPVILIPMFYKMKPLENSDLQIRLTRLLEKTGTKVRGIYLIEFSRKGTTANAALMGMGGTRRIVLSDTLINRYTHDEIETITAHEIGHYKHRDIMRLLGTQIAALLVIFFVGFIVFRVSVDVLGFKGMSDPAALLWLGIVFGAFSLIIMPLRNAFGRYIETQADGYSLELTENPAAFSSAMMKLTDQNLADAETPRWLEILFQDHPGLKQRLRHAEEYASRKIDS